MAETTSAAPTAIRLEILSGRERGQTIRVTVPRFLIGREVDCHLKLTSPRVSRQHCALLIDLYAVRIRDLGSRNGVFVNSHRLRSETMLQPGDIVQVGDVRLRIWFETTTNPPVDPSERPTTQLKGDTAIPRNGSGLEVVL